MFLVQRVFTRESVAVPFYPGESEYHVYFKSTYRDTGKCSDISVTMSQDGKNLLFVTSWASEEAFNAYLADPVVQTHLNSRKAYNTANNITAPDRVTTQL